MDWLTVIGLVLFGTFLIVAEIIFVPGTTIVGILGFLFSAYAIFLGYDYFGSTTGTLILIGALSINISALVIAFKGKTWTKLSLKETNTSKVNEGFLSNFKVGDKGISISSLRPIGKAVIKDLEVEVRSNGEYIEQEIEIEVIKISFNKIFVKKTH